MTGYEFWEELNKVFNAVVSYQEKSIEFNKKFITPWIRLGNVFDKNDRQRESISAYKKAVEVDPGNAQLWFELGNLYLNESEYEEALQAFRHSIELNPDMGWAYSNLGTIYMTRGNHEKAIECFERSIVLLAEDKDKAVSWNRLGNLYRKTHQYTLALEAFQKADELDAGSYMGDAEVEPRSADQMGIPLPPLQSEMKEVVQAESEPDAVIPDEARDCADSDHLADPEAAQELIEVADEIPADSGIEVDLASKDVQESPEALQEEVQLEAAPAKSGLPEESQENLKPAEVVESLELSAGDLQTTTTNGEALLVAGTATTFEVAYLDEPPMQNGQKEEGDLVNPKLAMTLDVLTRPEEMEMPAGAAEAVDEQMQAGTVFVADSTEASEADNETAAIEASVNETATPVEQKIDVDGSTAADAEHLDTATETTEPEIAIDEGAISNGLTHDVDVVSSDSVETFAATNAATELEVPLDEAATANEQNDQVDLPAPDSAEMFDAPTETTELDGKVSKPTEAEEGAPLAASSQSDVEEINAEATQIAPRNETGEASEDEMHSAVNPDIVHAETPETTDAGERQPENPQPEAAFEEFLRDEEKAFPLESAEETDPTADPVTIIDSFGDVQMEVDINNAKVWNELGNVYYNNGALEDAIVAYAKSIELDRSFAWPYSNLALAYIQKERLAEAILLYQRSIELFNNDKDKAVAWNCLGNVYRRMNDYSNAISAYQRADVLDPNNVSSSLQSRFSLLGTLTQPKESVVMQN